MGRNLQNLARNDVTRQDGSACILYFGFIFVQPYFFYVIELKAVVSKYIARLVVFDVRTIAEYERSWLYLQSTNECRMLSCQ